MKKTGFLVLLTAIFLVNNSCGNPFLSNIYSEKYTPPSAGDVKSAADIIQLITDNRFLDALAENPELAEKAAEILGETVADVLKKLKNTPSGEAPEGISDEEKMSILAQADVKLAASQADESMEQLNDIIAPAISGDSSSSDDSVDFNDPASIRDSLIAVDRTAPKEEQTKSVAAQIDSLMESAELYSLYEDVNTNNEGVYAPADDGQGDAADIASKALLSGLVNYLVENMKESEVPQEIKDANPPADGSTYTPEEWIELKKATFTQSVVEKEPIPEYVMPPGTSEDDVTGLLNSILEEEGLGEVVDAGLDLDSVLSLVGG